MLACGGVLNDLNGTLTFPENDGGLYPHQVIDSLSSLLELLN